MNVACQRVGEHVLSESNTECRSTTPLEDIHKSANRCIPRAVITCRIKSTCNLPVEVGLGKQTSCPRRIGEGLDKIVARGKDLTNSKRARENCENDYLKMTRHRPTHQGSEILCRICERTKRELTYPQ